MQNTAFWCRNCSVEFDPESENVRRESKQQPQGFPISIHHKTELEWGARELSKKGTIKFTS